MAYSNDLRQKAIEHYREYNNISSTGKTFNISRPTLYSWIRLLEAKGNLERKVRVDYKTKIDYERLRTNVAEKPDLFLREYASEFDVTPNAIWNALRKLKITRKKKLLLIRKQILLKNAYSRRRSKSLVLNR